MSDRTDATSPTAPSPTSTVGAKAAAAYQKLGLPGVLLVAAFLADLLIILPASFDDTGSHGTELLLLPGIVGMAACALWARKQPVAATWVSCFVLGASMLLIRESDVAPYSALLNDISFTETVAGVELVYFCVGFVRGGLAFVSVFALVTAAIVSAFERDGAPRDPDLIRTAGGGAALLVVAVAVGIYRRRTATLPGETEVSFLLRRQWPLVGGLTFLLFAEVFQSAGLRLVGPVLLAFSAVAGCAAIAAMRRAELAAVVTAGAMALTYTVGIVRDFESDAVQDAFWYRFAGGLSPVQLAGGIIVVIALVRYRPARKAIPYILLLSATVAVGTAAGFARESSSALQLYAVAAVLVLGIAVTVGLYFRARDSERERSVKTAVSDAQTAERMALARELHDVVAHHVTGIVVQAQAARMIAQQDPTVVDEALGRIEDAGTEAMVAMRRLVSSMRGDAPAGRSDASEQATTDLSADLRKLVELDAHGVPTELDLDLPADLPQEVARSALRIVQESLTNTGKHAADATLARVSARVHDGQLHLRVSDNGGKEAKPGAVAGGSGGYGLVGMRERVELLHGRLSAGRGPEGGWVVEVWLPVEGENEQ